LADADPSTATDPPQPDTEPARALEPYAVRDPEVALMLRVQQDDASAYEQLVERWQARIRRLMETWVHDKDLAEDFAQEVFLRVYRSRKNYQPTAKFSTWIIRIANNVANNAVRDRSRRREQLVGQGSDGDRQPTTIDQLAVAKSAAMPVRRLDQFERREMVRQAMLSLNERQRTAMTLSKFEGLSYQEIADAMETSTKAVKSLLSRGRVALKALLEPYLAEGTEPAQVAGTRGTQEGVQDDR
jgi:RNA polymerase sigma-70 factor, ECF subfamily